MDSERYEISQLIGKGRTGGVYSAEDTVLSRKVAIRRFFSAGGETDASKWTAEFTNISQNLCNLQHPNLLTIFDAGVDEDGAFMVSQLIDGKPLVERLQDRALDEWEANDLANQLLDAFATAHVAGFTHGALTAGSLLMVPRARGGHRYIILDLGLSRLAPLIQGQDSAYAMLADPALMAPELFQGESATERSDCYMLGQLIYLCLANGHPFAGQDIATAAQSHIESNLPPLNEYRPDISMDFIHWLNSLLETDPSKRPATAAAALATLPQPQRPSPNSNKPRLQTGTPAVQAPASTDNVPTLQASTPTLSFTPKAPVVPTKTQNKKGIVIAASAAALLVVLFSILGSDDDEISQPPVADNSTTEGNRPTPKNSPTSRAQPVPQKSQISSDFKAIYKGSCSNISPREISQIERSEPLSWVICTGAPIADQLVRSTSSKLIQAIDTVGIFTPSSFPQIAPAFYIGRKNKKVVPALCGNSKDSEFKRGDGWLVKIKTPSNQEIPLEVTSYFTAWNCPVYISVRNKKHQLIGEKFEVKSQYNNFTAAVTSTITGLAPGETFFLEITTGSQKNSNGLGLSLHAVKVDD